MSTDESNATLDDLFARARNLTADERDQFIRAECADPEQRTELLSLLAAYEAAPKQEFVNRILPQNAVVDGYEAAISDTTNGTANLIGRGQTVGPYKILQQLGEGGMGTVYMAEQTEPVTRRVALKLIKSGMDSRDVLARFEAERQALSMMDHPNIAKVLDAGSDGGRPYFVMELVKGLPITEYCDNHRLSAKQRLELFTAVCRGVAHAHQKGIIHRDIKPSNVLVAEYDDDVVPKIIDFGVAKATTQKLTEKTLFTRYGQLVGTVEYMSPEQAKLNQLDIDTRSDVYSLGILLYELLVGTTPFDRKRLRSAALDEMLRIISEEEPPKLSRRFTTHDSSVEIAARRNTRPETLSRMLYGELDWIVMRSLEKDRKRRYQSVSEFVEDVQCHLAGQAVSACPPTWRYRMGKFVRRYKVAVAMACLVIGMLSVSSLVGWVLYRQAEAALVREGKALEQADEQKDVAEQHLELAMRRLRESESMRLVALSSSVQETSPIRSALLAIDAVEATWDEDREVLPTAREALVSATSLLGGEPLLGHTANTRASLSTAGQWLAASGANVRLWDLSSPKWSRPRFTIPMRSGRVCVSRDGGWLVVGNWKDGVRLWALHSLSPESTELGPGRELIGGDITARI